MRLEAGLQAFQDLDRLVLGGLGDVDLLEAADQGAVLLEVVAELLVGGRADAAQVAAGERRLEDVRGVERAAAGGAGADHGVDLVDEQDRVLVGLELGQHGLQALLEVAAVAGAGEQRAQVERVDDRVAQDLRAPRPGRSASARPSAIAVLPTPGSPTNSGLFLERRQRIWIVRSISCSRPDQDVDPALAGLVVEVGAVGGSASPLCASPGPRLSSAPRTRRSSLIPGFLAIPWRDVVHRVEPRHVLLLQEEHGVGLALGEQRHQHVGAGDLLAAGRLDVDRRALDDPLEAGGRLGVDRALDREAGELVVEEVHQARAQPLDLDRAGLEHGQRVLVLGQRHEQMLEGRVLVLAGVGQGQRPAQRLLEVPR